MSESVLEVYQISVVSKNAQICSSGQKGIFQFPAYNPRRYERGQRGVTEECVVNFLALEVALEEGGVFPEIVSFSHDFCGSDEFLIPYLCSPEVVGAGLTNVSKMVFEEAPRVGKEGFIP